MRLWLKDSERRPDPAPVKTDDRKAVLVGLALWVVALVVILIVARDAVLAGTCAVGIALGLIGLAYTQHRRRSS
jgi:hypothetical protein